MLLAPYNTVSLSAPRMMASSNKIAVKIDFFHSNLLFFTDDVKKRKTEPRLFTARFLEGSVILLVRLSPTRVKHPWVFYSMTELICKRSLKCLTWHTFSGCK
jgi:hypothetical protein